MDILNELKADFEALRAKFEAFAASLVTAETPVVAATVEKELADEVTGNQSQTGHDLASGVREAEGVAIEDAANTLKSTS